MGVISGYLFRGNAPRLGQSAGGLSSTEVVGRSDGLGLDIWFEMIVTSLASKVNREEKEPEP